MGWILSRPSSHETVRHLEEEVVNAPLVLQADVGDLLREGEDDVEVFDGQELIAGCLQSGRGFLGWQTRVLERSGRSLGGRARSGAPLFFGLSTGVRAVEHSRSSLSYRGAV